MVKTLDIFISIYFKSSLIVNYTYSIDLNGVRRFLSVSCSKSCFSRLRSHTLRLLSLATVTTVFMSLVHPDIMVWLCSKLSTISINNHIVFNQCVLFAFSPKTEVLINLKIAMIFFSSLISLLPKYYHGSTDSFCENVHCKLQVMISRSLLKLL